MDQIVGDDGNRAKCQRHGVSVDEIESVFLEDPAIRVDYSHAANETRFRAVGQGTSGRYLFVVFTIRGGPNRRLIRPISARYMHRKEIKHYEEAIS